MSNRNYKQMGDDKLLREARSCPPEDVPRVQEVLTERGMDDTGVTAAEVLRPWTPPKPMLAKAGAFPSDPQNWTMERKLDGWRLLAVRSSSGVDCYTRTGKRMDSLPYINDALLALDVGTILDGEIVDMAADMGQEWNRTQTLCSRNRPHVPTEANPALTFMVFDVLEYEGEDWRGIQQRGRRDLLEELVDDDLFNTTRVRLIESTSVDEEGYQALIEFGAEGVVLKRKNALYVEGKRSPDWIKIKPKQTAEATITGTYPATYDSKYDGLAVGGITFKAEGDILGRCAGMDDTTREAMYDNPFAFVGRVVELEHGGITADGLLRFPRFKRFRAAADKEASEV